MMQEVLEAKDVTISEVMEAWVDTEGCSPFDNSAWAVALRSNPSVWYTERGLDFSKEERDVICQEMENDNAVLREAYIEVLKHRADLQESYRATKTRWSSHAHLRLIELGVEYRPQPTVPMYTIRGPKNVPPIVLRYK